MAISNNQILFPPESDLRDFFDGFSGLGFSGSGGEGEDESLIRTDLYYRLAAVFLFKNLPGKGSDRPVAPEQAVHADTEREGMESYRPRVRWEVVFIRRNDRLPENRPKGAYPAGGGMAARSGVSHLIVTHHSRREKALS